MNKQTNECCPLCSSNAGTLFSEDKNRIYIKCDICALVFVPERFFMSREAEKKRYDCHNNSPDSEGYLKFLHKLSDPLLETLDRNLSGLDFGSGPVPVLAGLLEAAGHTIETFDIFYDNRPELLEKKYDFITMCEVIEHLHHPMAELKKIFSCIKPEGLIAVMTQPHVPQERFSGWRYKNDPTHVLFFSDETFRWLADEAGFGYENPGYGVFFFKNTKKY